MKKSNISISTYVQYVEDFHFWMNVAGLTHHLPDKEIAKYFVHGLKPEEMYIYRAFDTLDDVIREV